MDIYKKIAYFYERKFKPGLKIKRQDVVIDIGSGDKPFWRANVFLDKLSLKNLHRHSDSETINTLGTFVDSDIIKTPFKDKTFDYSFCAHLLEHVERPDLALNEIMRISKKGYIEVPNGVIEFISPFHSHLWFILKDKNKLIFYRKGDKLHHDLLKNSDKFYKTISNMEDPFIRIEWKNKIQYEIADDGKSFKKYEPPNKTPKTRKNPKGLQLGAFLYMNFVRFMRKIYQVDNNVDVEKLNKSNLKSR